MPRHVRLCTAELHYDKQIRLHTATSGAIDALNEVYLTVSEGDRTLAIGGVRTNIAYLTGIPEPRLRTDILALVQTLDWTRDLTELHRDLSASGCQSRGAARALVDCTLLDGLARQADASLSAYLGAEPRSEWPTNQTLFWGTDDQLERTVRRYLADGFRDLKLRVGIGTIEDDLRRVCLVREVAGELVGLAIDANGTWSSTEALANLERLADLGIGIEYAEQPTAAGDWDAIAALSAASPIAIMLDESLASRADVEELAYRGAAPLAHLKIVKLGGLTPLIAAARRLASAGIGLMIGQMSEGTLATAAAAHAAMAVRPRYSELYGAYGLVDDPASGLAYRRGSLVLENRPGLGVDLDSSGLSVLWEKTL